MNSTYTNQLNGLIILSNEVHDNKNLLLDKSLYKIICVEKGNITLNIDHAKYDLHQNQLIALSPYQHIEFEKIEGKYNALIFNSNFYCIYGHDNEVSCGGLLFNSSGEIPYLELEKADIDFLKDLFVNMEKEFDLSDTLREEMLRILLKSIIILCTRKAREKFHINNENISMFDLIRQYRILVDNNFKSKKQVQEYAEMLNKSPKSLARVFSDYNQPSPLQIIHERVATEARRLLLYSSLSAKEIAWELGFEDLALFSRFFKSSTGETISEFRSRAMIKE